MGYAHGMLLPERMRGLVGTFWSYMEEQVVREQFIKIKIAFNDLVL
jgi:hypothetical protein